MTGSVLSVNVGTPRVICAGDREILTATWSDPVTCGVPVTGVNLRGDDQADRTGHGGPDKAVYAYACEGTAWCDDHYRRPLGTAPFGEKHPACGVDVSGARIGERWRGGSALLEVCQPRPRLPCFKLALRDDDPHATRRFARARRPGADPWIVEDGALGAGDAVRTPAQARARGHHRARQRDLPVRSRSSVHGARGPRLAGWPRDWAALGGPI